MKDVELDARVTALEENGGGGGGNGQNGTYIGGLSCPTHPFVAKISKSVMCKFGA